MASENLAKNSKYFTKRKNDEDGGNSKRFAADSSVSLLREPPLGSSQRLGRDFYDQECRTLAVALLGQTLVRQLPDGSKMWGMIIETEAYLGGEDKASHSYQNKKTRRNEAMFMISGTLYTYSIYGMYCCMNISSRGDGAAVLLRAVEPLGGMEMMHQLRHEKHQSQKPLATHQLCNGPSKICLSFSISKQLNMEDLTTSQELWLEKGNGRQMTVITCSRIGMSKKSQEWATAPLRYYVSGSTSVSVVDRVQERLKQASSI